ncbi:MAG: hypothetical protein ACRDRO_17865 [Pseudonocardiaceae bacterium]
MIRWGLSAFDWRDHAINESRQDSTGVLTAECGHRLRAVTPLRAAPCGTLCQACGLATRDTGPP